MSSFSLIYDDCYNPNQYIHNNIHVTYYLIHVIFFYYRFIPTINALSIPFSFLDNPIRNVNSVVETTDINTVRHRRSKAFEIAKCTTPTNKNTTNVIRIAGSINNFIYSE